MTAAVLLALYAGLYLWGVARYERRTHRPFPRSAIGWELVALISLWIAIAGLDAWADASFAAHMAQHVVLIAIVAPALILGAPLRVLLGALPRTQARTIARLVRSHVVSAATAPAVAWIAFVVVLWGAHYSPLYEMALENPAIHFGEHVAFVASAALFWSHAFPVPPLPARLAPPARAFYVFVAGPSTAFLGLSLWSSRAVLYAHYLGVHNPFGLSAIDDQRAGGLIMWVSGSVMTLVALLFVLARWAKAERARTLRSAFTLAFAVGLAWIAAPARAATAAHAAAPDGKTVYATYCASCHGVYLQGGPDAPSIRGVGAADVDWWVGTGRMPAAIPWVQQQRRPPLLSPAEVNAVVGYVVSVAPGGPPIPQVETGGNLQRGRALFAENCEHCHGADAQGNSIGSDYIAPDLYYATVTQVGEAVRVGVGMMPKFGEQQLSQDDLNDIVTYVDWLRSRRQTPGGIDLSSIGPFGEGAVAWLVVTVGITGYAWFLGTRMQRANETKEPEPVD